jgi:two-component sensor histidine kinase
VAIWRFIPKLFARIEPQRHGEDAAGDWRRAAERDAEAFAHASEARAELEKAVAAHARELEEINRRFKLALLDTGVSMSQQDCDLRYVWLHNAPHGLKRTDFIGQLQADVMPPEIEPRIAEAKRQAMAERAPRRIEIHATIDGHPRWFDERISPVVVNGKVVGVMTTSIDTTIYRMQEAYMRDLLRELTHRTKNLLAVILGIARQSGRVSPDIGTFVTQFSGRIRTLSITHELLVNANWTGVDLKSLLQAVWRAASPRAAPPVHYSGLDYRLAPESAQNLALAFHEMAVIAAPGNGAGVGGVKVCIDRTMRDGKPDGALTLVWEEPANPGADRILDDFAKSYLEVLLPRATGGSSELHFTDSGLRWTLDLPTRNFVG